MARLGVMYQDIATTANQLVGQGKQPTIEMIRHTLGTGSSTTIANHLRKWRAEQDRSSGLAPKDNLPPEIIAMMKGLWEQLNFQAQEKINLVETSHQQTLAELQQDLQKYKNNNQRWQQLFNQWQQEKTQLANDKLTLEQAIVTLQKDHTVMQSKNDTLQQQLQDKQERVNELQRFHAQAQANLEHYRESAREQRLIEQQQFEQQKQELLTEIKLLKEQVTLTREKATAAQQQQQILHHAHVRLEQDHATLAAQFAEQHIKLNTVEQDSHKHLQASLHWQNHYQEAQKILETNMTQLIAIQAETKVLAQQLSEAKQSLSDALDQNKLLGHEKWVLMQEKAQLEGQLKQMQKTITA